MSHRLLVDFGGFFVYTAHMYHTKNKAKKVLDKIHTYPGFADLRASYGIFRGKDGIYGVAVYLVKNRPEGLPDELDGVKLAYKHDFGEVRLD